MTPRTPSAARRRPSFLIGPLIGGIVALAAASCVSPCEDCGPTETGGSAASAAPAPEGGSSAATDPVGTARGTVAGSTPDRPPAFAGGQTTIAARSLSGFWKVTGPAYVDLDSGLFSGIRITYGGEVTDRNICLIEDRSGDLKAICSAGDDSTASGDADGDDVSLHWWQGPATLIFHGRREGAERLLGTLSGGVVGLSITGGIPVTLTRLTPTPADSPEPPGAALVRDVLEDLRDGHLTAGRYGPEAIAHLDPVLKHPPVPEPPLRVSLLGSIHIRWRKKQADKIQDVYRVDTANGGALCRIAVGTTEAVADFDCRSIAL